MQCLDGALKFNIDAPIEVRRFVNQFKTEENLIQCLSERPTFLIPIIQNVELPEDGDTLAAKLIYLFDPDNINDIQIEETAQKVINSLQSGSVLNFAASPNFPPAHLHEQRLQIMSRQNDLQTEFQRLFKPSVFGKEEWEKFFGSIKDEDVPPLPENIYEILESPDPVDKNKKVKETHTFFLRPKRVNGNYLTIYHAEKLGKNSKAGHKTGHWFFPREQIGNARFYDSQWILLRNEVVDESRSKSHWDQIEIIKKFGYQPPHMLDLILQHMFSYVTSEKGLYTWDCVSGCSEVDVTMPYYIGNIKKDGFHISEYFDDTNFRFGMAGSWSLYPESQFSEMIGFKKYA